MRANEQVSLAEASNKHRAMSDGRTFLGYERRRLTLLPIVAILTLLVPVALASGTAKRSAAPMLLGLNDDSWIGVPDGAGIADLQDLQPQIVRLDAGWANIAPRRPGDATNPDDPAYDFSNLDRTVSQVDGLGIPIMMTIETSPSWAALRVNQEPRNPRDLEKFAYAIATRYSGSYADATGTLLPQITRWEAWSEPNLRGHLYPQYACGKPTCSPRSPKIYARILNAIYSGVHTAGSDNGVAERVAGGANKPSGCGPGPGCGDMPPLLFLRLLAAQKPHLDAYSHHPYPIPGGAGPDDVDFRRLPKLIKALDVAFPGRRLPLWITEYGIWTNPPNRVVGVSPDEQVRLMRLQIARARANPRIEMLIWFLIRDTRPDGGFATGLAYFDGTHKPAWDAFRSLER